MLDELVVGIVLLDRNHCIVEWNAWMANATSIDKHHAFGQKIHDLFPILWQSALAGAIQKAFEQVAAQSSVSHALPVCVSELGLMQHCVSVRPIRRDDQIYCLLQFTENATGPHQRDHKNYAHAVESAIDAIVTTSSDGSIEWMNSAAELQFGWTTAEVIGRHVGLLFDAADLYVEGYAAPHDVLGKRKDGSRFSLEVAGATFKSEGRRSVTRIFRDITHRKHYEARLAKRSQGLELLTQASAQLLICRDVKQAVEALYNLIADSFQLDLLLNYQCEGETLRLMGAVGLPLDLERRAAQLPFGTTVCGLVAQDRRARHFTDILKVCDDMTIFLRQIGINSYFSTPLLVEDRLLGTLSFGRRGHAFSHDERQLLSSLANHFALAAERLKGDAEIQANENRWRRFLELLPVAAYTCDHRGRLIYVNAAARELWGRSPVLNSDSELFCGAVTAQWPDGTKIDREETPIARALHSGRSASAPHEITVIREDGSERVIVASAEPLLSASREVMGAVAVSVDVTERKMTEARQLLLSREVDHRAKNLLAVIQSVIQMTRADTVEELSSAIAGRIHSLARAHSLLAESRWDGAELTLLIEDEFAAFGDHKRLSFEGPRVRLNPSAAQAMALVIHELATNAAKYGALSEAGKVSVCWSIEPDGRLNIRWEETGGPTVSPPTRRGFGSSVIQASVERQLCGEVKMDWHSEGLVCNLNFPTNQVNTIDQNLEQNQPATSAIKRVATDPVRRVLVVEDEVLIAMQIEMALVDIHCAITGIANSEADAFKLLDADEPSAVLLDLNLNGQPTYAFADRLIEREIPFAFVTGYAPGSGLPDRFKSIQILAKPFSDDALAGLVSTLTSYDVVKRSFAEPSSGESCGNLPDEHAPPAR